LTRKGKQAATLLDKSIFINYSENMDIKAANPAENLLFPISVLKAAYSETIFHLKGEL
jgi:hypothetical protein